MNSSKTRKLALVVIVVTLVFCFIPVVQGTKTSNKSITILPIEDWLMGNPLGAGPGYLDPDSMLSQRCLGTVADAESYEGYVVEKILNDGSRHYTVNIEVKGVPMAVLDWIAGEWIFVGMMDFRYTAKFILEEEIPGGEILDWDYGDFVLDENGNPAPLIVPIMPTVPAGNRNMDGWYLPSWWILYFYQYEIGGYFEWMEFKSQASGNFIEPGWYPSPTGPSPVLLEEGNVMVHQIAIYGYNLPLNNPNVNQYTSWSVPEGVLYDGGPLVQSPLLMPEMWPVEYVKFY
ncbi:MAG: hypothetical protein ACFFBH_01525 [Promethearchaeota archaeon]